MPGACRATGRGLQPRGVRVKQVADFRVDTRNAGSGDLKVSVKGPSELIVNTTLLFFYFFFIRWFLTPFNLEVPLRSEDQLHPTRFSKSPSTDPSSSFPSTSPLSFHPSILLHSVVKATSCWCLYSRGLQPFLAYILLWLGVLIHHQVTSNRYPLRGLGLLVVESVWNSLLD